MVYMYMYEFMYDEVDICEQLLYMCVVSARKKKKEEGRKKKGAREKVTKDGFNAEKKNQQHTLIIN